MRWQALIEALIAGQNEESTRRQLQERLDTLLQLRARQALAAQIDNELFAAFIQVETSAALHDLVARQPELLDEHRIAALEAVAAAQIDANAQQHIQSRIAVLKQINAQRTLQATGLLPVIEQIIAFANSSPEAQQQTLTTAPGALLDAQVEAALDLMQMQSDEAEPRATLDHWRILLRRCRQWGVEPTLYLSHRMRLGDSIPIPPEHEAAILQTAMQLTQAGDDPSRIAEAGQALQDITDQTSPAGTMLFRAALLRDLADTLLRLPPTHPVRDLAQLTRYYQEAIAGYAAAERPISVAYSQRSLGNVLEEQGQYREALAPLQAAAQALQDHDRDSASGAYSTYASALANLGDIAGALAAHDQAVELEPAAAFLLCNRATARIQARQLAAAEADLAQAVQLDGHEDSPYLWARRAQIAIARGNGTLADQLLDEVAKCNPPARLELAMWRAQSAWLRGDVYQAQQLLYQALLAANAGQRSTGQREWEQLFADYPQHAGIAALRAIWTV